MENQNQIQNQTEVETNQNLKSEVKDIIQKLWDVKRRCLETNELNKVWLETLKEFFTLCENKAWCVVNRTAQVGREYYWFASVFNVDTDEFIGAIPIVDEIIELLPEQRNVWFVQDNDSFCNRYSVYNNDSDYEYKIGITCSGKYIISRRDIEYDEENVCFYNTLEECLQYEYSYLLNFEHAFDKNDSEYYTFNIKGLDELINDNDYSNEQVLKDNNKTLPKRPARRPIKK